MLNERGFFPSSNDRNPGLCFICLIERMGCGGMLLFEVPATLNLTKSAYLDFSEEDIS